ncbi:MAG: hypothetical protein WCX74_01955 [Candidatus Paceibacterota bacterium]
MKIEYVVGIVYFNRSAKPPKFLPTQVFRVGKDQDPKKVLVSGVSPQRVRASAGFLSGRVVVYYVEYLRYDKPPSKLNEEILTPSEQVVLAKLRNHLREMSFANVMHIGDEY